MAAVADFVKSDFYKLFTSFVKGKVTQEILKGCRLFYKCKTCNRLFIRLETYMGHYAKCNRARQKVLNIQQNVRQPEEDVPEPVSIMESESIDNKLRVDRPIESEITERAPKITTNVEIQKEEKSTKEAEKRPVTSTTISKLIPSIDLDAINKANKLKNITHNLAYTITLRAERQKMLDYKTLRCRICNEQFSYKNGLICHFVFEHSVYKKFTCGLCAFKTDSTAACVNHAKEIHSVRKPRTIFSRPFKKEELDDAIMAPCILCGDGKKFKTQKSLAAHFVNRHLGSKYRRLREKERAANSPQAQTSPGPSMDIPREKPQPCYRRNI